MKKEVKQAEWPPLWGGPRGQNISVETMITVDKPCVNVEWLSLICLANFSSELNWLKHTGHLDTKT